MTVNPSGWRPSTPANEEGEAHTVTGNRALMLEEPLIFEIGSTDQTGVDFDAAPGGAPGSRPSPGNRLAGLERLRPLGLPGLSEPETVRHYTRLSRQNYAIDLGLFPLGSCTMKHNPRLNEKVARLPGFADVMSSVRSQRRWQSIRQHAIEPWRCSGRRSLLVQSRRLQIPQQFHSRPYRRQSPLQSFRSST